MRSAVRVLLGVVAAVALTVGAVPITSPPPALACSCVENALAAQLERADVVVRGVVTAVERPWLPTSSASAMTYTVELSTVWKGEPPRNPAAVRTAMSEASCGAPHFPVGDEVLIVGAMTGGRITIDLCGGSSRTNPELLGEVGALLGPGTPARPLEPNAGPPGWLVGLLVPAAAGLVVGVVMQLRKRRRMVRGVASE
ncbi:hypothetical protein [Microlunatus sp. Y2014]|uniref:hypothetical protein n=1 Tax=Microlunatus sp. Y2014 TaxID=3418488 RepID=UPI003DA746CC